MEAWSFDHLKEKTCVITGGAGVIGSSLAHSLSKAGMKVALLDLNEEMAVSKAKAIQEKTGVKSVGVKANVLDKSSLEDAKKKIHDEIGSIDYLINGAGGNSPKATTAAEMLTDDLKNDLAARLVQQGTTSWLKEELFKKDRKEEEDPNLTDEERKEKEEKRKKKEGQLEQGADALFKLFGN